MSRVYRPCGHIDGVCDPCKRARKREYMRRWNQNQHAKDAKLAYRNTPAQRERSRAWHASQAQRAVRLGRRYRVRVWFLDLLWRAQSGLCAICDSTLTPFTRAAMCVDHDHETGAVRGLLCTRCNTGVGMFQERRESLARAADYLERYGK